MRSTFSSTMLLISLLASVLFCAMGSRSAYAVPNPFAKYQPDVVVSDPYIEMHTGPGGGYPIFYVAGQGDQVRILKRKTDWFKVRVPRGSFDDREGWVHIDQMRHTLDLDGNPLDIPRHGVEEFSTRRWEFGLGGGDIAGAATINGYLGFNLNPYIGLQGEVAQILGDYSDGYMGSVAIVEQEIDDQKLHYVVAVISNVLRRNSTAEHQALATRIHRLLLRRHGIQ